MCACVQKCEREEGPGYFPVDQVVEGCEKEGGQQAHHNQITDLGQICQRTFSFPTKYFSSGKQTVFITGHKCPRKQPTLTDKCIDQLGIFGSSLNSFESF